MDPVAVINGGTRGIGKEIADTLEINGYIVHSFGRDTCDARDFELVEEQAGKLGRVDVLVNVAGAFHSCDFVQEDPSWLSAMIMSNLITAWNWSRTVLPGMRKRHCGYILNISSMAAKRVRAGCSSYSISKSGMNALTEAILRENVQYGIKATAICPGDCDTHIGQGIAPGEDLITLVDISQTVVWLLSLSKTAIVPEVCIERRGRYL